MQINTEADEQFVKKIASYLARRGLKYEKRMMLNIKSPRINFMRNPEDPLHGYYKQKLTEYVSQIQETGTIVDDFGDDVVATKASSSTQVTEPPPGPIAKEGLPFETVLKHLCEIDAKYSFMNISDSVHAFYQQKLIEYRNQQDRSSLDYAAHLEKADEYVNLGDPQRISLPYGLDVRLLKGMNVKEFTTMKLTAQFGAWYGNDFWLGFKNRDGFEFTNPTDSRFPRFSRLVFEYSEVFKPPKGLKEMVSKSDVFMAAIHSGFFRLLDQWDSHQEMKWGEVMCMSNWHASLVKDFAKNEELPLTPEEEPEPKSDEPGLVPEDQFLAQHPGWCTIRVSIVNVDGNEVDIIEKTVQSLSENVASFKEQLAENIPPEKQVLFGKAGLLKDNNKTLAYYNVGAYEILTLSLCTCGREKDLDKPCCCNEIIRKSLGEIRKALNSCFD